MQAIDTKALLDMHTAQSLMHSNLRHQEFVDVESRVVAEYKLKHKIYTDEFLKQKSKMEKIRDKDENATLFHQSIRA